eukprot:9483882-Pyramimonas_sp.AAC.1
MPISIVPILPHPLDPSPRPDPASSFPSIWAWSSIAGLQEDYCDRSAQQAAIRNHHAWPGPPGELAWRVRPPA